MINIDFNKRSISKDNLKRYFNISIILVILSFVLSLVSGYAISTYVQNLQCDEELKVCDIKCGRLDTEDSTFMITEDGLGIKEVFKTWRWSDGYVKDAMEF